MKLALLTIFAAISLPVTGLAQTLADDLLQEVEGLWAGLEGKSIGAEVWRDKKRFVSLYDDVRGRTHPSAEDYEQALSALRKLGKKKRRDEHFQWRAHELAAHLLWDSGERTEAIEELEATLDAYPDERYPEPRKHSSYQHIANQLAWWIWEEQGIDSAEEFALTRFVRDRKYQFFYLDGWKEQYADQGDEARYDGLVLRVIDGYRTKAKKDRKLRDLYKSYLAQLESLLLAERHTVGGDERRTYYLLRPANLDPKTIRQLVLVLPGGHGRAKEFLPWLSSVQAAVGDDYVFAVLSATRWSAEQEEGVVWVTEWWRGQSYEDVAFSTEDFIRSVRDDVLSKKPFKVGETFLFGWSSSGPAVYAAALEEEAPYAGAIVHSSVFKPGQLDLSHAPGRAFYLLQGRGDELTALVWAQQARDILGENDAEVHLEVFAGGHGFGHPNAVIQIRRALDWLRSRAGR